MEPKVGQAYLFYKTAKDIWEAVPEMYSELENTSQCCEICSAIRTTRQGSKTVTKYFNTLMGLWQEMDLFYDNNWHCPEDCIQAIRC